MAMVVSDYMIIAGLLWQNCLFLMWWLQTLPEIFAIDFSIVDASNLNRRRQHEHLDLLKYSWSLKSSKITSMTMQNVKLLEILEILQLPPWGCRGCLARALFPLKKTPHPIRNYSLGIETSKSRTKTQKIWPEYAQHIITICRNIVARLWQYYVQKWIN